MEAFISKNYNTRNQDGVHCVLTEMLSGKCNNDIDIEIRTLFNLRRLGLQVSRRLLRLTHSAYHLSGA